MHTLVDGVRGMGQYVGTYLAWGSNSRGWWGEGEMKFYLDGDTDFPTICGTGTEDYFGGAWNFDVPGQGYTAVLDARTWACTRSSGRTGSTTASSGSACTAGTCPTRSASPRRCGSTVQALGWRAGGRYLPLHDDIASTALFYLDRPTATRPPTPELDDLER